MFFFTSNSKIGFFRKQNALIFIHLCLKIPIFHINPKQKSRLHVRSAFPFFNKNLASQRLSNFKVLPNFILDVIKKFHIPNLYSLSISVLEERAEHRGVIPHHQQR